MLFFSLCNKLLINNEQADNVIMRAGGKKGHFLVWHEQYSAKDRF